MPLVTKSTKMDEHDLEHMAEMRVHFPHIKTDSQLIRYALDLLYQQTRTEKKRLDAIDAGLDKQK